MQQISIYLQYFLLIIYRLFKYLLQLILLILNPLLILFLNLFGLLPVFKNKCDSIIDTKIAECQNDLDDYLKEKGIKKRYTIKWDRSGKNKIPNANAAFHKRIILTGDWSFLKVDKKEIDEKEYNTIEYLYLTVGHELGHKDSEPFFSSFSSMHNYIREVRADFCGVDFANSCNFERQSIINSKYAFSEFFDKQYGLDKLGKIDRYLDSHPSNYLRKKYLESSNSFSEEVIRSIITDYYQEVSNSFFKTPLYKSVLKKALTKQFFT